MQTTYYAELTGRGGQPCPVWRNLTDFEVQEQRDRNEKKAASGLRGLLTQSDLYVWESVDLLHSDFERLTGVQGMRIVLRAHAVHVNNETVALPEFFPWVFSNADLDNDDRRHIVKEHLRQRLRHIYPTGFAVFWYQ